jgi:hypothetical protein
VKVKQANIARGNGSHGDRRSVDVCSPRSRHQARSRVPRGQAHP